MFAMTTQGSYKDLHAWQKAMELVLQVYEATRDFPKEELYGLVSQLRRSAVSVPSNIAEGKGRATDKDFLVFLHHARGSVLELETQVLIARKLGFLTSEIGQKLWGNSEELAKMLNALINSISRKAAA